MKSFFDRLDAKNPVKPLRKLFLVDRDVEEIFALDEGKFNEKRLYPHERLLVRQLPFALCYLYHLLNADLLSLQSASLLLLTVSLNLFALSHLKKSISLTAASVKITPNFGLFHVKTFRRPRLGELWRDSLAAETFTFRREELVDVKEITVLVPDKEFSFDYLERPLVLVFERQGKRHYILVNLLYNQKTSLNEYLTALLQRKQIVFFL